MTTETNVPSKVFTISLEFELGPHKTSKTRLRSAYSAAVAAAADAVEDVLLDESVANIHATMTYDYRFLISEEEVTNSGEPHELVTETEE